MKFFFPDSQDLVDPSFDFERERRNIDRIRQRDDLYAHEVLSSRAFDGLLVSKGIVDGFGETGSRYSAAQRHRLFRVGVKEFFRLKDNRFGELPVIGDCGAFTYVKEPKPPFSVDDVLDFYAECGFDYGISVDHVILAYQPKWDDPKSGEAPPSDVIERQKLTIELARDFFKTHKKRKLSFKPMGVAQGWSPHSYANAVKELQRIGYDYIAVGGLVPLKTPEIVACLEAISAVRNKKTKLHLLGVTRTDEILTFERHGVVSFDSTSPLRQAFKDDKDNYYTLSGAHTAIRVPQVEGNPSLQKQIRAGKVGHDEARRLETACLAKLKAYDQDACALDEVVDVLGEYERLCGAKDHSAVYRELLSERPWRKCGCGICGALGYHVVLFRGAERNRRRGFHNIWVFYRRLHRELGLPSGMPRAMAGVPK